MLGHTESPTNFSILCQLDLSHAKYLFISSVKILVMRRKCCWSQRAPISLLLPSLHCSQQCLGNCFQGPAKLDPRDCNNHIPVVLTFSFVPQAAEDRQGAICHVRWPHSLAISGGDYFSDTLHSLFLSQPSKVRSSWSCIWKEIMAKLWV